jgi:NAD(P)-dependent dehydrogenase (short-subunit alcohol dehydrogenase family)
MQELEGKIALVTGAGSGIGAATAARLADAGFSGLILVDRNAATLGDMAATLERTGLRVLWRVVDVANEQAWLVLEDEVRSRFGRLDWAVANAGIAHGEPLAEHAFDAWRRVLAVNLDGTFLTLRSTLRLIRAGGRGGAIVVVASAAAIKPERCSSRGSLQKRGPPMRSASTPSCLAACKRRSGGGFLSSSSWCRRPGMSSQPSTGWRRSPPRSAATRRHLKSLARSRSCCQTRPRA